MSRQLQTYFLPQAGIFRPIQNISVARRIVVAFNTKTKCTNFFCADRCPTKELFSCSVTSPRLLAQFTDLIALKTINE